MVNLLLHCDNFTENLLLIYYKIEKSCKLMEINLITNFFDSSIKHGNRLLSNALYVGRQSKGPVKGHMYTKVTQQQWMGERNIV
jgi:hypothetical protein